MLINLFIQARMSSKRFPGKVLAPFNNKPIIKNVIEKTKQVHGINKVVVLTSSEESDNPLVAYLNQINCDYFKGELNNVFARFKAALIEFPCDYFVRISADSPLIDPNLIQFMLKNIHKNYDIISNVITRSFPKGQSVEIIKSDVFLKTDLNDLSDEEREHVFPYFYKRKENYSVCEIKNTSDESTINMCVDTIDDLNRLSNSKVHFTFNQELYV